MLFYGCEGLYCWGQVTIFILQLFLSIISLNNNSVTFGAKWQKFINVLRQDFTRLQSLEVMCNFSRLGGAFSTYWLQFLQINKVATSVSWCCSCYYSTKGSEFLLDGISRDFHVESTSAIQPATDCEQLSTFSTG